MTRILVNHITRMRNGNICVAGIDVATNAHVRPCLAAGNLGENLLAINAGPFGLGRLVDLGAVTPRPVVPEIEDVLFSPAIARATHQATITTFESWLTGSAKATMEDIFGPDVEARSNTYAIPEGHGDASLGCLSVDSCEVILDESFDRRKIRTVVRIGAMQRTIATTDLRLFNGDDPDVRQIETVNALLGGGNGAILAVGLARPFAARNDNVRRHWMQVNGIYPLGQPYWASTPIGKLPAW